MSGLSHRIAALLPALALLGAGPPPGLEVRLADVAEDLGVTFRHDFGRTGIHYIVETTGSGACVLDADGDGDDDVYLINGGVLEADAPGAPVRRAPSRLFRNDGGRFTDVTELAGVGGHGFGMGCSAADVDADGDVDILVTNVGADELFLNDGSGRFRDVAALAGIADPRWTTSAGFADHDGDGDLDLYVAAYVDFAVDGRWCDGPGGLRLVCQPRDYEAIANRLYRNDGTAEDGTPRFTDVTAAAGVADEQGKSLGVLFEDLTGDGRPDIYVANDTVRNTLFVNDGAGRFSDATARAGVGLSDLGVPEAGMGLESGDLDGDGIVDLLVTNFQLESNTVYRGLGAGRWADLSESSGMARASLGRLAFGVTLADFDLDGDLDAYVANGHVDDKVGLHENGVTHAQADHVLENRSGRGRIVLQDLGAGSIDARPAVSRGTAWLDLEGDGDVDVVVNENGGPAALLENRTPRNGRHWLAVRLEGPPENRDAIGALVTATPLGPHASATTQRRRIRVASSFLSSSPPRAHFGLGAATGARVAVTWPDGTESPPVDLAADRLHVLRRPAASVSADAPQSQPAPSERPVPDELPYRLRSGAKP